jgi:phage FluMu protein Com
MPIRVVCPCGQELLTGDEAAGLQIQCPRCQSILQVPAPRGAAKAPAAPGYERNAPPEDEDDFDEDEEEYESRQQQKKQQRQKLKKDQLKLVNFGIGLHYVKLMCVLISLLIVVTFFAFAVLMVNALAGAGKDMDNLRRELEGAIGALLLLTLISLTISGLLAPLLGIMGSILCYWMPSSRARPYILMSAILDSIALVIWIVLLALGRFAGFLRGEPILSTLGMSGLVATALIFVFGLASWTVFMTFLRKLALYLDQKSLANDVAQMRTFCIIFFVATPLLFAFIFSAEWMFCIGSVIFFGGFIAWIAGSAKFVYEVLALIQTMREELRKRTSK